MNQRSQYANDPDWIPPTHQAGSKIEVQGTMQTVTLSDGTKLALPTMESIVALTQQYQQSQNQIKQLENQVRTLQGHVQSLLQRAQRG